MNSCESCGEAKPSAAVRCPSCGEMDRDVMQAMVAGTPGLSLLVLAVLGMWIFRFWILGWAALPGNLRFAALAAAGLGFAGLLFGPLWSFGVRSRAKAAALLLIAIAVFLIANLF